VSDRTATTVADQHHGRRQRIDRGDNRVNMVAQADVRAVGIARLETGKSERVNGVPGIPEWFGHVVPRGAIEPEAGDEKEVHGGQSISAPPRGQGLLTQSVGRGRVILGDVASHTVT
jgi:hypothetical protein